jgi:DNA-binding CsgD family transcriptional regulator
MQHGHDREAGRLQGHQRRDWPRGVASARPVAGCQCPHAVHAPEGLVAGAREGVTRNRWGARRGSHQLKRPNSATAAGTSSARTTVASRMIPAPSPVAIIFTCVLGALAIAMNPRNMISAANGDALLSPSVTRRLIAEFASRAKQPSKLDELAELTDREREVMALAAEGLSNDEIAARLIVSPATAKTHVSRAMVKLGARDRAQLVVLAYETGLVRPGWID